MKLVKYKNPIHLTEFTITFIIFGISIVVALMAAELTPSLIYHRTIYSVWVTTALLIPALCLYILPGDSEKKTNYWLLFWNFSFLAYSVHFYYAVFVTYGGIIQAFKAQKLWIAVSNYVLTAWWSLDVVLAWFTTSEAKWIKLQRLAANIYIYISFVVATIVLKTGFIRGLGIVMTIAVLVCLGLRVKSWIALKQKTALV